jgi:hypothetical protein
MSLPVELCATPILGGVADPDVEPVSESEQSFSEVGFDDDGNAVAHVACGSLRRPTDGR